MKLSRLMMILLAATLTGGCFWHKSAKQAQSPKPAMTAEPAKPAVTNTTIVTPDNSLTAKVVSYNSVGRFVVLAFPIGQMPKMDQSLFLYRDGLKVAEIKITGPQSDNNIVADLVTGDAQLGDEVRDQ